MYVGSHSTGCNNNIYFNNGNYIRFIDIDDKRWFSLKDICKAVDMNLKHLENHTDELISVDNVLFISGDTIVDILLNDENKYKKFTQWCVDILKGVNNYGK